MSKKLNLILSSGLLISPIPLMSTVSCSNSAKNNIQVEEIIDASKTDYYYSYNLLDQTATVTGLKNSNVTSINIPEKIKYKGLIYGINSIGKNAFNGKGSFTSLILPNAIGSIGDHAFKGCNFNEIKWPKWLKSIGYASFQGCNLQDLILPDSLTSISTYAFLSCKVNGVFKLPNKLKSVAQFAFYGSQIKGDLILPDSLESIGGHAFQGSGFNGKLKLPNNPKLTTISTATFQNNSFSSIEISDSITSIDGYAFYGSMNGEELVIPKSVTSIGNLAFYIRSTSPIKKITIYKSTYGGSSSNAFSGFKGELNIID